jgi:hypothetical protein
MQNIELYIEGQRVELFKDESVSLTQSIQNVRIFLKYLQTFLKRLQYQLLKQIIRYLSIIITLALKMVLMVELKKML